MSALTAATGGPDDNDAQAGHLVYVKAKRAATDLDDETWNEGGVSTTLNDFDNATESRATVLSITGDVAHALTSEGSDASEDGMGRGTPNVFSHTAGIDPQASTTASPSVLAGNARMPADSGHTGVRRLTPVEGERLQGFPDGWTAVRDTDTPQADSSRYRQLGNAVAVPVAEWIFRRIALTEETP